MARNRVKACMTTRRPLTSVSLSAERERKRSQLQVTEPVGCLNIWMIDLEYSRGCIATISTSEGCFSCDSPYGR